MIVPIKKMFDKKSSRRQTNNVFFLYCGVNATISFFVDYRARTELSNMRELVKASKNLDKKTPFISWVTSMSRLWSDAQWNDSITILSRITRKCVNIIRQSALSYFSAFSPWLGRIPLAPPDWMFYGPSKFLPHVFQTTLATLWIMTQHARESNIISSPSCYWTWTVF